MLRRVKLNDEGLVDWTKLPHDLVIQLFSRLNYRDRANLSSTCTTWFAISKSPCLWSELNLRAYKFDAASAALISYRCENLQKLRFCSPKMVHAIINLRAKNVREISCDSSREMTDSIFSLLVARHESVECLVIGSCGTISSDGIETIAFCCPKLKKLHLSGIYKVINANVINALAKHCKNLTDVGFINCRKVDEAALGNFESVRFLSVAETIINWDMVLLHWHKLPNLIGLDVSGTDINFSTVWKIFSTFSSLKVLCALSCPSLEEEAAFVPNRSYNGKVLLAVFTDILKGIKDLFVDIIPNNDGNVNVFLDWGNNEMKYEKKFNGMLGWLECVISNSLVRVSVRNPPGLDNFWLNQGTKLMLTFIQSAHEEVQERAAKALANFFVNDDENASIDTLKAEAVMRGGGVNLLLELARSWKEGLQSEAAKAIANLSLSENVAKAVAKEGGINILVELVKSSNRLVSEDACGGLLRFTISDEQKRAVAEAGGIKALVDIILKWSKTNDSDEVLERAARVLSNLAEDDECSAEIASAGGVHALFMLAGSLTIEGEIEHVATWALAMLAIGEPKVEACEALVQLSRSPYDSIRHEADSALWNLSRLDDKNQEAIAAAGEVE